MPGGKEPNIRPKTVLAGSLVVQSKDEAGTVSTLKVFSGGLKTSSSDRKWKQTTIPLPKNAQSIVITGYRGRSYTGDMAIDNLMASSK